MTLKNTFIFVLIISFQTHVYGQPFLSDAQEIEIKESGKFFWGESSHSDYESAKNSALNELINYLWVQKKIDKTDELLETVETKAQTARLQPEGIMRILAWIDINDILPGSKPPSQPPLPPPQPQPSPSPPPPPPTNPSTTLVPVTDPRIVELTKYKTRFEVTQFIDQKGHITGPDPEGFFYPENCLIAVFDLLAAMQPMIALLHFGKDSRIDVLTGETVQNPENFYNDTEKYFLLYIWLKE